MLVEIILGLLLLASIVGNIFLFRAFASLDVEAKRTQAEEQKTRILLTDQLGKTEHYSELCKMHEARIIGLETETAQQRLDLQAVESSWNRLIGIHETTEKATEVTLAHYAESELEALEKKDTLLVANAELAGMMKADDAVHQRELSTKDEIIGFWEERDEQLVKMYIELTDKVIMGKTETIKHGPLTTLKSVQPPLGSKRTA